MTPVQHIIISDELQARIDAAFLAGDKALMFELLNTAPVEDTQIEVDHAVQSLNTIRRVAEQIEAL